MSNHSELSLLRESPWSEEVDRFVDLVRQGDSAFLLGAGCSVCAGLPTSIVLTEQILDSQDLSDASRSILNWIISEYETLCESNETKIKSNIEDYLSELIDLLAIVKRRSERNAKKDYVEIECQRYTFDELLEVIENIKSCIACAIQIKFPVEIHQTFIRSVHSLSRDVEHSASPIVDYMLLNYDTIIETALALEQIPYTDGIEGGVSGWWNPMLFDKPGIQARVLKLHGSVDWFQVHDDPRPRRITQNVEYSIDDKKRSLIWPATTKYQETQLNPFAQIIGKIRELLTPEGGSQRLLVICGYSFGDSHINLEIERSLREANGNLNAVIFTDTVELSDQLATWRNDNQIGENIIIYSKRGFFHRNDEFTCCEDLPWWRFEIITRLLSGER